MLFFEFVTSSAWAGSGMSQLPERAPEFNDSGVSLLLPAWTFGKLTNLFSVLSVERNPNCLFLLVEVGPPTEHSSFIQTRGWRSSQAPCGQASGTGRNAWSSDQKPAGEVYRLFMVRGLGGTAGILAAGCYAFSSPAWNDSGPQMGPSFHHKQ